MATPKADLIQIDLISIEMTQWPDIYGEKRNNFIRIERRVLAHRQAPSSKLALSAKTIACHPKREAGTDRHGDKKNSTFSQSASQGA